jgi:hypothetical protein
MLLLSEVHVNAQLSHYGHDCDLMYTPLPVEIRENIKRLLRDMHRIEDIPIILRKSTDTLFTLIHDAKV